jgi:hypothetical protein
MGFIALAVVIGLFLALFLWDRSARKHGHRLRSSSEIIRSERDVHRNIRASDATLHNPLDAKWSEPDARRYKRPDDKR